MIDVLIPVSIITYLTLIKEEILMTTATRLHLVSKLFLQRQSFLEMVMMTGFSIIIISASIAFIVIIVIVIIIIIINLNIWRTFQPHASSLDYLTTDQMFNHEIFNHDFWGWRFYDWSFEGLKNLGLKCHATTSSTFSSAKLVIWQLASMNRKKPKPSK